MQAAYGIRSRFFAPKRDPKMGKSADAHNPAFNNFLRLFTPI